MYKVILIILATVVNELAAAYDESKLVDNCTLVTANQYSNGYNWIQAKFMEASVHSENLARCIPEDLEPSWKLFPNFKPGVYYFAINRKMNFRNCVVKGDN